MDQRFYFWVIILLISSCTSNNNQYNQSTDAAHLKDNLKRVAADYILFGHQDDLSCGIGWQGIKDESDVKRVAGDYPALFGWEIGNIGDEYNLDGVPFDSIITYIQRAHRKGGVNSISWHARHPVTNNSAWIINDADVSSLLPDGDNHFLLIRKLDLVADFMHQLKADNGTLIPLIFRPWHDMNGSWFWWGTKTCSNKDYISLFRFTVNYLRINKGLNNLLIAYSPDADAQNSEIYLTCYPGDEYVDILGIDNYADFRNNRLDNIVNKISFVVDLANQKGKIAAFTETGNDKLTIPNWYTSNLLQVLKANEKTRSLAYVMVWRNRDADHFYVPHNEHAQADDFRLFIEDNLILLLEDYNRIKN